MYFRDLLPSDANRKELDGLCADFSAFSQDCISCMMQCFRAAEEASRKTPEPHHATNFLLMRHAIESLDGVSVLLSKGCSQPCQPLLRSALEASLGIFYILEADTKRRALAYQVAHAHKKIKLYERADPTTAAGKELRAVLKDDCCAEVLNDLSQHGLSEVNRKSPEYAGGTRLSAH